MRLLHNYHYVAAMLLFCIGMYNVIVRRNIVKKLIGLNIMETAVFFFYIALGYMDNGVAPIAAGGAQPGQMVNPLPQALILTGIVVAVSVTALALALAILLYRQFGTLDVDRLFRDEAGETGAAEGEEGGG